VDGVVLVFVLHSNHSTLFTIRQAGWGPKDVCNSRPFGTGLLSSLSLLHSSGKNRLAALEFACVL